MYFNTDLAFEIWVLDFTVLAMCAITAIHCLFITKLEGLIVSIIILNVGFLYEFLSINFGNTHCHAEAGIMIHKCFSLNSWLYYLGWMYSCYWIGNRVPLKSSLARYLLIAILHAMFGLTYELVGVNNAWYVWLDHHALQDTLLKVPILTIMFHFFFGMSFSWSKGFVRNTIDEYLDLHISSRLNNTQSWLSTLLRICLEISIVSLLAPIVTLLPITVLSSLASNPSLDTPGTVSSMSQEEEEGRIWVDNDGLILKALSVSILIASIVAVFADPIFREVNFENFSFWVSYVNDLSSIYILQPLYYFMGYYKDEKHEKRSYKDVEWRWSWNINESLFNIRIENKEISFDRDILLLIIPHGFTFMLVTVTLHKIYIETTHIQDMWSIFQLVPLHRLVTLLWAFFVYLFFTYFNFAELQDIPSLTFNQSPGGSLGGLGGYKTSGHSYISKIQQRNKKKKNQYSTFSLYSKSTGSVTTSNTSSRNTTPVTTPDRSHIKISRTSGGIHSNSNSQDKLATTMALSAESDIHEALKTPERERRVSFGTSSGSSKGSKGSPGDKSSKKDR